MKPDTPILHLNILDSPRKTSKPELAALLPADFKGRNRDSNRGKVNLRIEGGHQLSGDVTLRTSKNAAVALLCASLLNYGVTRFPRFPQIEEVFRMIEVLESIGVVLEWMDNSTLEVRRPEKLQLENLDNEAAKVTRSILMLIGVLMHESKNFEIPNAGGCQLGQRTVEPHVDALAEFGVDVIEMCNQLRVTVNKCTPCEITLHEAGNTVTNNVLLAAARTFGETFIQAASADYMVQDLCFFLQKLGVGIEGIGTPLLRVKGAGRIQEHITYSLTEDPIEAMFFITTAVVTDSEITIRRVPFRWISLELLKLKKMGLRYTMANTCKASNGCISLADLTIHRHKGCLQALSDKIHPNIWPGINPDSLPYFVPIAAVAAGRTIIHDWMYDGRTVHYCEMAKLGVAIEMADPHRVYVEGPTKFHPPEEKLACPPALRPATILLISMLAANGVSVISNIYTINRGYENLVARLNSLGAHVYAFYDD
ncbi:hypothetical protein TWF696_003378 [Orbilia brochopaga]|uniref:UDP-N-acetylglucosamine 1-carboxyvinyltransferase n=1 Tax=Orbilia brochopaga TaxID=3140254 RepID=A0AAV9TXL5_9PEZI